MIVLRIPEASPSLNEFSFSHWRKQHTLKKKWLAMLTSAAIAAKATKATGKRKLTIERYGLRRLDPDNIVGGAKGCIIDNLRALSLLVDDHDDAVELSARNMARAKGEKPYTNIILQDIE